ncbi:MAG TPA: sugar phosphate isomerase/epimerase [Roseimicrobium sp.]|nr:sugar phosphate isomerase/epimerase [Roseimicrobium sp.]
MNRLSFFRAVALSAVLLQCFTIPLSAAEKAVGTGKSFKGPVGLQLYSLRAQFTKNLPEALKTVQSFGVTEVELAGTYNLPPEKFLPMLKEHGLVAISAHFPYDKFKKDPESIALEAKALGLKYAGCAYAGHKAPLDEKQAREIAEVFNKAGEVLKKHGIQFFYHCHGFEFQPFGEETLMDLLIKETNPEFVKFQMDIMWVVFPGQDPVKFLNKYPKRWELIHLKDLKKGVATGSLSGKTDVTNDVTIGTGQMDWPAILKAAKKAGVKHYFIEDESPTSVEQIPNSLKYLESVKF